MLTHQGHSDRSKAAGQTLAERPFAKAGIAFGFVLHRLKERWTKLRQAEAGRVSDIWGPQPLYLITRPQAPGGLAYLATQGHCTNPRRGGSSP